MLEKEIKILEIDKQAVIDTLVSLGAKKTFEGIVHDVYYDFPDDDTHKMEANNRMFRLRQKGQEHIYTIKRTRKKLKKKEGVMWKDEHETPITNIESFAKVLEKYGMKKTREKKKHRVSYGLEDMEFDVDSYEAIPTFLEIEGPDGDTIQKWVRQIGLQNHEQMIGGSRKLFKHYDIPYTYHD